jgi:hypothetical protein
MCVCVYECMYVCVCYSIIQFPFSLVSVPPLVKSHCVESWRITQLAAVAAYASVPFPKVAMWFRFGQSATV